MKEDRKIKNVVPIMLDTLQFNYLGCYGNKVVKTPSIRSPRPSGLPLRKRLQ